MKEELSEVKMSMIHQRSQDHNQKKMYQCKDSVNVLNTVCEKKSGGVGVVRQQEEDEWIREDTDTIDSLDDDDSTSQENHEDDDGTVMEMIGWIVTDEENKNDLT